MTKKHDRARRPRKPNAASAPPSEEQLQGPPPREALLTRDEPERQAEADLAQHSETSPALSGGDVDADWRRADSTGEEAVGGSVATPDQDVVDEIGDALGVSRPADAEIRTSSEIVDERDWRRWENER